MQFEQRCSSDYAYPQKSLHRKQKIRWVYKIASVVDFRVLHHLVWSQVSVVLFFHLLARTAGTERTSYSIQNAHGANSRNRKDQLQHSKFPGPCGAKQVSFQSTNMAISDRDFGLVSCCFYSSGKNSGYRKAQLQHSRFPGPLQGEAGLVPVANMANSDQDFELVCMLF